MFYYTYTLCEIVKVAWHAYTLKHTYVYVYLYRENQLLVRYKQKFLRIFCAISVNASV